MHVSFLPLSTTMLTKPKHNFIIIKFNTQEEKDIKIRSTLKLIAAGLKQDTLEAKKMRDLKLLD